jgi:hypothetical protein
MAVDHFDPRKKKDKVQSYDNLMPATSHCNHVKRATWPSDEDLALGMRFIDPSKEDDYGVQIFEDPRTFELVATTPAGWYHIENCGLNAQSLINKRRDRAVWRKVIEAGNAMPPEVLSYDKVIDDSRGLLQATVDDKIPPIPPPSAVNADANNTRTA